jgi:hypothetical protein
MGHLGSEVDRVSSHIYAYMLCGNLLHLFTMT